MKSRSTLFLLMLAIMVTSCQQNEEAKKIKKSEEVKVKTYQVKKVEEIHELTYSGIVEASVNTHLSFQIPGSVIKILVEEGDRVIAGQVIAKLDKSTFQSVFDAALASHKQAEDAYNRLKKVHDNGSLAEIDWQDITAKLAQSDAALKISEENLKKCILRAPSSGIIGKRDLELGMNVTPNITVFQLLKIDPLYVRIAVPENEIMNLAKNQTAMIKIPAIGEQEFSAQLKKLGVSANTISKTYEVKLLMANDNSYIKPGMMCDVFIDAISVSDNISIPYKAVLKDSEENPFVYVVDKDSKEAETRMVEVDGFNNNYIQISSGLQENEIVVVEGHHKLSSKTKVII